MAYLANDAKKTLFGYLETDSSQVDFIENTNNRGFIYTIDATNKCVIFIYPISHKADDSKNFFDTRDSGARERAVAWNYALSNNLKYFCLAVHDQVDKYKDYIFSLETDESRIAAASGTANGARSGSGTQVVIPNNYVPNRPFDRMCTRYGFYIAAIHRDNIKDYIEKYDNRPYMLSTDEVDLPESDDSLDAEEAFKIWLLTATKNNGEFYTESTRTQYITALKAIASEFTSEIAPHTSIFEVNSDTELSTTIQAIKDSAHYPEFNDSHGNGALSAGLTVYHRYLVEQANIIMSENLAPICVKTGYANSLPRNRIFFGAPGTGKSYTLNKEKDALLTGGGESERVTFHPDYSYANFVGTYKPVPCQDSDGKDAITYTYVPGPFMRTLVKALKNSRTDTPKPYLLMIEEINRANVAAVFGEVFQLLDRDDDEVSEYAIQASEDIKKYLASQLGGIPSSYNEIQIPDNMFIWSTMNSADQGVFPMDTAFKRRWDFTYLGIDDSESGIVGKTVILGQGSHQREVEWNALRKAINHLLLSYKVNEDKLMGPYFLAKKSIMSNEDIDATKFIRVFKNKVIMYLFDDAAKQKRISLFSGCEEVSKNQYSKICHEFDAKGIYIFGESLGDEIGKMVGVPSEDDAT